MIILNRSGYLANRVIVATDIIRVKFHSNPIAVIIIILLFIRSKFAKTVLFRVNYDRA